MALGSAKIQSLAIFGQRINRLLPIDLQRLDPAQNFLMPPTAGSAPDENLHDERLRPGTE
ncbi:hypothetical protein BDW66DRAFT_136587 [Aspergillus desertorum]